jgi:hypothetical protein
MASTAVAALSAGALGALLLHGTADLFVCTLTPRG